MFLEGYSFLRKSVKSINSIELILLLVLVMSGLTASCGKKNGDEKRSQSVASVNGDDITVLQINNELQRANVPVAQQEEAGKQIVSVLIDRQLLLQQAYKLKLDRNSRIMQAIESDKAQILAQAYLENKVSKISDTTDTEISDYLAKHAELFANRKIFVTDELSFKVEAANRSDLQTLSNTAKTLDDVLLWLKVRQTKYTRIQASHDAETLSPQLLSKLTNMVVGDNFFINSNGLTVVAHIVEIKDSAIAEKDSKPIVSQLIYDQKRKKAAEDEVTRLRTVAYIQYINAKFKPSGLSTMSKVSGSKAEVSVSGQAKAALTPKIAGDNKSYNHVEKGLSGL